MSNASLEYFNRGSASFLRKINKLVDAARRIPLPGANITADESPKGVVFNAFQDAVSSQPIPFAVYITQDDPKNPTAYSARVEENSFLLKDTYIINDTQDITGTSTYDNAGNLDPTSKFTFRRGDDLIWLEILLGGDSGTTDARIRSLGQGHKWTDSDKPGVFGSFDGTGAGQFQYTVSQDAYGNNVYSQNTARIPIFSSITRQGSVINQQLLTTNLKMGRDSYFGLANDGVTFLAMFLSMPVPYCSPYVKTGDSGEDGGIENQLGDDGGDDSDL